MEEGGCGLMGGGEVRGMEGVGGCKGCNIFGRV